MWKTSELLSRRLVLAALLAAGLGTAAFAFSSRVEAQEDGCGRCLLIAHCMGNSCSSDGDCGGDFCCPPC